MRIPVGFFVVFLLLLGMTDARALKANKNYEHSERNLVMLNNLDSIIANHAKIEQAKEERIAKLRSQWQRTTLKNSKLGLTQLLFEEYKVYDADSALYYIDFADKLAREQFPDNYELNAQLKLNRAFVLIVLGRFAEAEALLNGIDVDKLDPDAKARFYEIKEYRYSMEAVYIGKDRPRYKDIIKNSRIYRDSIILANPTLKEEWLWVPIAVKLDIPEGEEVEPVDSKDVQALEKSLDSNTEPSRFNAINAYWLARYYEQQGDLEKMFYYMTLAATYNAIACNRELPALPYIASHLFDSDDITRAYNYMIFSFQEANKLHNRARIVDISSMFSDIRDAYREELEKKGAQLRHTVIALVIVSFVVLVILALLIFEYRKLRVARNTIEESNKTLQKLNSDLNDALDAKEEALAAINDALQAKDDALKAKDEALRAKDLALAEKDGALKDKGNALADLEGAVNKMEQANRDLSSANRQKLGIVAYAFKITTDYINNLEKYRKKLLKQFKAKDYSELGILINDPDLINQLYLRFYDDFDNAVLSIFPDIIAEYNENVEPDHRVDKEELERSGKLNTRLRIYALRRLGVEKSADIANMLNISVRTVYNNRIGDSNLEDQDNN